MFAHLRTPWNDLPYHVGDTVNLVAQLDEFDGQLHCLLDMENGMLVLHPDVLLSGGAYSSGEGRLAGWLGDAALSKLATACPAPTDS